MQISVIRRNMTREQIDETARQSAKHFLFCFSQDNLDIMELTNMMKRLCDAHKELAVHLGLLRYCKLFKHDLPEHYMEIVANNDTYDHYCHELTRNLISIVSEQNM